MDPTGIAVGSPPAEDETTSRRHIRGSWLLVVGRVVNVALDFAAQVLTVRYLSTSDYGAFAYALSVVSLTTSVATLGLDKAVGRFVPMYDERREYGRLVGAWLLVVSAVLTAGFLIVVLVFSLQSVLTARVISDTQAMTLLLILVVMSPLSALGAITSQMLATYASPMLILVRNYLFLPVLQVAVVLVIILSGSGVELLAIAWVGTFLAGSIVSMSLLITVLRRRGLLRRVNFERLQVPARELFLFGLPLLASNVIVQLRLTGVVILLESMHGTTGVGLFRAAIPIARQNLILFETFQLLFTPLAARLFTRKDARGLNEAYWQSAMWITVFTFPLFIVTFALAEPMSVLLYGERYQASGPILAILTFGFYISAALGFNEIMLRIFGRVGYGLAVDVATTVVGLAAGYLLIAQFGAVGAAVSVTVIFVAQKLLYHVGLLRGTGIRLIEWRTAGIYATVLTTAGLLLLLQLTWHPPFAIGLLIAAVASLVVLLVARETLRIGHVFPELLRLPLARWLIHD